ncbi:MAG: efflux RND transporter periplasmic adaptor subunit [Desulfobacterales bacterium]|jgi:RND family efflux transporter MFP subunit|nr:efflux RND transporter periplasmic adaptor subunit [Desulfobacterales bacterium]
MKRISGRVVTILILFVIVVGLAMALHKAKKQLAAAPVWQARPSPVETAIVREGNLSRSLRYLARLEAVSMAEIAPKINARIVSLEMDEGDTVATGDVLARLDDRDVRAQITGLEATIEAGKARLAGAKAGADAARSNLAYAERENKRDKRLFDKKGISASTLEASQNQLDEARSQTLQAEEAVRSIKKEISALKAQLAEARTRLSYATIRADYPGTIQKRYAELGDMAMPGKPIFNMMDISSFRLAFELVEDDLALIQAGQTVRIQWSIPVPANRQTATVTRIFPSLELDQTVRAEIDLFCPCSEKLKVGSLVPIEVVVRESRGLIVPQTAIVPTPAGGSMVYVVREGRLQGVPVQLDLCHNDQALILGELEAGEAVAVGEYLQWVRLHENAAVSL